MTLISATLVRHQCVISVSSAHHQRIISASSVHHQCIIRPDQTRPDQTRPGQKRFQSRAPDFRTCVLFFIGLCIWYWIGNSLLGFALFDWPVNFLLDCEFFIELCTFDWPADFVIGVRIFYWTFNYFGI